MKGSYFRRKMKTIILGFIFPSQNKCQIECSSDGAIQKTSIFDLSCQQKNVDFRDLNGTKFLCVIFESEWRTLIIVSEGCIAPNTQVSVSELTQVSSERYQNPVTSQLGALTKSRDNSVQNVIKIPWQLNSSRPEALSKSRDKPARSVIKIPWQLSSSR